MTIKKRIASIILFLALIITLGGELLSAFVIKASAAETVLGYDDSPIEADMANMNEVDYPYNEHGECEIIGFMEYCYSENTAYSSVYGLYIYVYNPTEKALRIEEGDNQISLSTAFGEDGKASKFENCGLTYLDNTSNYRFYKFKVADSAAQYLIAKDYASRFNGKRRYEITSLDVWHSGEFKREESIEVSAVYEWTGYAAWCGEPSISISTLDCQYSGNESIHLKVHDTNYRFAEKSDNLYDDLQSVYFSVPNSYMEQWGILTEINAEWYQYRTKPCFVTSDGEAYAALYEMIGKRINEKGQLIDENGNVLNETVQTYWRVLWEQYSENHITQPYLRHYFAKGYNFKSEDGFLNGILNYSEHFQFTDKIDWLFYRGNVKTCDDYDVSSDEIKEYIANYAVTYPVDTLLHKRYPAELFENPDPEAAYKNETFTIYQDYEYLDSAKDQSWWSEFWFGVEIEEFNYSPIVTVFDGDLYLEEKEFSEKYLVNKDDVEEIKAFVKEAYSNNETPVLLRFALSDYYASNARFDFVGDDDMSDFDGYVAQEEVFLDFDIISLTFQKDKENKKLIGVVSDSIDIINGLTAPQDIPVEEQEWWQIIIALLVFIIILKVLSMLFKPFKVIFEFVIGGIKLVFSIVWFVATIPFRIIGFFVRKRA